MKNELESLGCSLINLPKIGDRRGNLTFIENAKLFPFSVQRIFYLYDIPAGESRGAHSHLDCHQFLIAASGAFSVVLDNGKVKHRVTLDQPSFGLHIPPMIWAHEESFSSGSICLVLASHKYDEQDYIRNYDDYLNLK